MRKYAFITITFFFVFSIIHQADALKCWRCSSDSASSVFCKDPFEPELVTEEQKRWIYVDCDLAPSQQMYQEAYHPTMRPVCKKLEQIINDKVVISRSCSWEDIDSSPDDCLSFHRKHSPSYIKTESCKTCTTDGCNAA